MRVDPRRRIAPRRRFAAALGPVQTRQRKALLPTATLFALALGTMLRAAAFGMPFHSDDCQQIATLHGRFLLKRAAWDLFWFGPRDAAELRTLVDFGFDPWWTASDHRLSMFRPLSSLLIALDDKLFGSNAFAWHVHSFVWWGALVCATAWLFSRVLPDALASCALVLFALDEAHNTPLAWLANRSTLVAATFGVLALCAHLRAREDGVRGAFACSLLGWALALLAGEYAFGMLAYLAAYELFGARDGWRARVLALWPAGALASGYLGLRAAVGHTVGGSGMYVAPTDMLRFAPAALSRVPALAGELILGVPATWWRTGSPLAWLTQWYPLSRAAWDKLPSWHSTHVVLGVIALGIAALALRWLTRTGGPELRALRWLAAGSLAALLGSAGAEPSSRLLVAPAIGASALLGSLVAQAILGLARARTARRRAGGALLVAAAVCLVHVALASRNAYADSRRLAAQARASRLWSLRAQVPRDARDIDVVVVSASDFATAVNVPWLRALYGAPLPHSYRRLSGALQAHDLTRVDDHTLDLSVLSTDVRDAFAGSIYRPRDQPLNAGQRVAVTGFEVEVLAADEGNPWRLRFRFDRALDDPHLVFLHARPEGLKRFRVPAVGETLRLPRAAVPGQFR